MLTEARDIGQELGNTEIRAEAMSWRVPAFVALSDMESARREVAVAAGDDGADGAAVPHPRGRALRIGNRALRRAPGRGRGAGPALAGVEPAADRAGPVGRVRDPDVQRSPRAGAPGGAGAGDQDPGRRRGARGALAAGARGAAGRARDGGGGEARAVAAGGRRARPVPRVALAGRARVPDRRGGGARRPGGGGPRLSGARAARGGERDGRPPRLLLWRGRPLPGDARVDPGRVGARGGALRAGVEAEPRAWEP